MKYSLLATIALLFTLSSCGQNNKAFTGASSAVKNRVVLGAFNDMLSNSTYNEAELQGLPRVVDLSAEITPARDQSDRGTCTFFSTAALIESAIKKDLQKDVNISEEYLSYATKAAGYFSKNEGSNVDKNLYAVQSSGLLLERDWSYQPSWFSQGLPCEKYKADDTSSPLKCFTHNKPDTVTTPKIISAKGLEFGELRKNTNAIIKFLAKNKRALTISVTVNFNGWPDTGDVYYNDSLRNECLSKPADCGGHSILLTGYDLDKKVFFFKNSWGAKWGKNGFGTITFNTVDRYIDDSLYYATATSDLKLPADYNKDYLTFEGFSVAPAVDLNNTLNVNVTGGVKNAQGRLIYVSSFLAKKSKDLEASDLNVKTLAINGAPVKTISFFMPTLDGSVKWNDESPLVLNYNAGVLENPVVTELFVSNTEDALLRTTIYVHTDDSSYKILKRVYQPIK
ncbi:MAG: C1 family peptidase [Bdellovibrionales bacterium]|nr:C1 family peptidase [Bdellovibrionales bacterium]